MSKLADEMFREPDGFRAVEFKPQPALEYALERCVPPELRDHVGIITNPATEPQNLINANDDGTCCCCAQRVWVAPSSRRVQKSVFICLPCIEREMQNL